MNKQLKSFRFQPIIWMQTILISSLSSSTIVWDVLSRTVVVHKFLHSSFFKGRDSEMSAIWLYTSNCGFTSNFCLILDKTHDMFR